MSQLIFEQPIVAAQGLSGSLFHTSDGRSYIVGSSGVSVTSGSNGQVILALSGSSAPSEIDLGNTSSTSSIDWSQSSFQKSTMIGNVTYSFTTDPPPCTTVQLRILHATTSDKRATFPSTVKGNRGFGTGYLWSADSDFANGRTVLVNLFFDGTYYWAHNVSIIW